MWYAGLALFFVAYALVAQRLELLNVTGPMVFLAAGLVYALLELPPLLTGITEEVFMMLMTLTLTLLLFADASTVQLSALRKGRSAPLRLLLVGLPLTVAAGWLGARGILPIEGLGMAALIGVVLAPTDVSLGLAMFSNERVPAGVRRGINVESGLNDGLVAPLVAIAISIVLAETAELQAPIVDAAVQILAGVGAGAAVGLLGGMAMRASQRQGWSSGPSRAFASFGLAVLAYVASVAVHGNGFVAAFVGGLIFGAIVREQAEDAAVFAEESGSLLSLLVWFAFGLIIGPELASTGLRWEPIAYALLSLTLFRMLPVAISLYRSGLRADTKVFMGWFGPRGLASVIFLLDAVAELHGSGIDTSMLIATAGWTIVLSVMLHGVSAGPVAAWYAKRSESFPPDSPELESTPAVGTRMGLASPTSRNLP